MPYLDQYEMDCLRRISAQPSGSVAACSEAIIQRLLSLGLIEKRTTTSLPLEMSSFTYCITPSGLNLIGKSGSR